MIYKPAGIALIVMGVILSIALLYAQLIWISPPDFRLWAFPIAFFIVGIILFAVIGAAKESTAGFSLKNH